MTSQDLAGRRALVTGGGSGIGLACAREFSGRGAHVIVADRDREAAENAATGLLAQASLAKRRSPCGLASRPWFHRPATSLR